MSGKLEEQVEAALLLLRAWTEVMWQKTQSVWTYHGLSCGSSAATSTKLLANHWINSLTLMEVKIRYIFFHSFFGGGGCFKFFHLKLNVWMMVKNDINSKQVNKNDYRFACSLERVGTKVFSMSRKIHPAIQISRDLEFWHTILCKNSYGWFCLKQKKVLLV